ncbi:MAG: BMP family protein [Oscillospiraceae bacterium]
MKKSFALALSVLMLLGILAGCGSTSSSSTPGSTSVGFTSGDTTGTAKDPANTKVILICDSIGTNPFLTQIVDGLEKVKEANPGLTTTVVESKDTAVWEDNIRAAVTEGNDLIIVAGSAGTDPITTVANEFPEDATYVLIDAESPSENVKSISFKEQEGAYLIGMIAGLTNPTNKFGGVHANENQSSYKWRWGYMQGVMAVRDDVTEDDFIFNYTSSYTDAGKAKELALQQSAAGCGFINAASAVADFGTFEAAQEKKFYTSGQDEDRTDPSNPYIITSQLKDTGVVVEKVITEYLTGTFTTDNEKYGVKEGVIGALYITKDGVNPRNTEVLTDEIVAQVKEAADQIASGELVLEVPMENG